MGKAKTSSICGANYTAFIIHAKQLKASGRYSGYSWLFHLKGEDWLVEIAEDPNIEPEDLPLVGYGCSGWLYQSNLTEGNPPFEQRVKSDHNIREDHKIIRACLERAFCLFKQKKLKYYPTVTCGCSDIS